jgi:hypothetical protein
MRMDPYHTPSKTPAAMDPYRSPSKTAAAYDADTLTESPHLWDVTNLMISPILSPGDIWLDEEYSYHDSFSEDEDDEDQGDKEQLANEDQEKELAELKARATLNVPLAVLSPTLALALQEGNEHASLDLGRHLTYSLPEPKNRKQDSPTSSASTHLECGSSMQTEDMVCN